MSTNTPAANPRFCSDCGTKLNANAQFCHNCGSPIHGRSSRDDRATSNERASSTPGSNALRWGVPALGVFALILITVVRLSSSGGTSESAQQAPLGAGTVQAPDISSMSPAERADRLFNRVMRLSSEGKADSAAFFGPMALGALEALAPLDAHRRYDVGLVSLVTGDVASAKAQSDTILVQRPTHLLGLALAARAADARGDAAASRSFRRRLLAAESAEKARNLPEYTDHAADISAALELARKR
ncbi:MAG: zinc-ribbon domain-containing protein [Gemmatimonadaceae bacterium]